MSRRAEIVQAKLPLGELEGLDEAFACAASGEDADKLRVCLADAEGWAVAVIQGIRAARALLELPECDFDACEELGTVDRDGIGYCELHAAEYDEHVRGRRSKP